MDDEESGAAGIRDLQSAAVTISVAILIFFVVYWSIQIESVRDLLRMAYG